MIFFFSIPAHGHVNPTLPVVAELASLGHAVRYYEVPEFRDCIEAAGAQFVDIAPFMPPAPENIDKIAGRDFASLIEMVADTTLSLDEKVAADVKAFKPSVIVSDSVCFWGKLFAKKYDVPFVCSTTTFAFNQHTAKRMKQSPLEFLRFFTGMPRIGKAVQRLKVHGYPADDFISLIQNDNETPTVVFASRRFQPAAHTFGDRYAFVGPSVKRTYPRIAHPRPQVYISLGTVLNHAPAFYRRCFAALGGLDMDVTLSAGKCPLDALGEIPANFSVFPRVNQLEVLASCDVFLTHCGMNSASESLLCGTPMVLFPQHSEEAAVAGRVRELGAGLPLGRPSVRNIRRAVLSVLHDPAFKSSAQALREDFLASRGAKEAADFIEEIAQTQGGKPYETR